MLQLFTIHAAEAHFFRQGGDCRAEITKPRTPIKLCLTYIVWFIITYLNFEKQMQKHIPES